MTDNGNAILDADFGALERPGELELRINEISGVLDNGIFAGMTDRVLIAEDDGVREWVVSRRSGAESAGG